MTWFRSWRNSCRNLWLVSIDTQVVSLDTNFFLVLLPKVSIDTHLVSLDTEPFCVYGSEMRVEARLILIDVLRVVESMIIQSLTSHIVSLPIFISQNSFLISFDVSVNRS